MERFLERHQGGIMGSLSGFDRVLFRGTLRSISYVKGLETFLSVKRLTQGFQTDARTEYPSPFVFRI